MIWSVFLLIFSISTGLARSPIEIHGGRRANLYENSHVVSLRVDFCHICGGSIISKSHVLTAASCLLLEKVVMFGNVDIISGTTDQTGTTNDGGEIHHVRFITFHEKYNPQKFWVHDIAIVTVTKPFKFTPYRQPGSLSPKYKQFQLRVSGWGGLNGNHQYLQTLHVSTLTRHRCIFFYSKHGGPYENQFCAVPSTPNFRYITLGDGGSPVTFGIHRTIIGIVSIISAPSSTEPFVATLLHPYIPFANEIMKKY